MHFSDYVRPNEILNAEVLVSDFPVGLPCRDSAQLMPLDVFFCMDGETQSGFSHLGEAKNAGASAIVLSKGEAARAHRIGIPVIEVENVRSAYALAWSRALGEPQNSMRLIAVTGTNGKTSVTHFTSSLLRSAGYRVGTVGTIAAFDGKESAPTAHTTPPPEILYPLLLRMKQNGCDFAVMEASSHAIAQERLAGLSFACGVFTGLSRDHLDYHKTWEAYRAAKAKLFSACAASLINLDDAEAMYMGFASRGDVYYYAEQNQNADFLIEAPMADARGLRYLLRYGEEKIPVTAPLFGDFNIRNTAAAIAVSRLFGVAPEQLNRAAADLRAPIGRLEKLELPTEFSVFIDYAHTPDALAKAITALRPLGKTLTVLFGAGGDRDIGKRPEMGRIAEQTADFVIVTSDNPRSEDPKTILSQIVSGMEKSNHIVISDRRSAIEYAVSHAKVGDVLLLAGKGHEEYLIDGSGRHDFSEREIVKKIVKG